MAKGIGRRAATQKASKSTSLSGANTITGFFAVDGSSSRVTKNEDSITLAVGAKAT